MGGNCMIIDGHAHSCGDFHEADRLVSILDGWGVDRVVLCPGLVNDSKNRSLPQLTKVFRKADIMLFMNRLIRLAAALKKAGGGLAERNELVYSLHQKYPDRILQFYWADPLSGNVMDELRKRYSEWHFKGIKLHQCISAFKAGSPVMREIALFARENRLPVFIHLYSKRDVKEFIGLALEHPGTVFIVGHFIGMERFKKYSGGIKNVYFDISPGVLVSDYRINEAIKAFGADHVLLGSDTPYGTDNLKYNLDRIKRLKVSNEQKDLILGKNMQKILDIW